MNSLISLSFNFNEVLAVGCFCFKIIVFLFNVEVSSGGELISRSR